MNLEKRKSKVLSLSDPNHFNLFSEFVRLETASGGPDPHLAYMGMMTKNCDLYESLWKCGCYVNMYNVPSAEVIWKNWPYGRMSSESMLPWIKENWKKFTTRTERKSVRIPENMVKFYQDYDMWMTRLLGEDKFYLRDSFTPRERYALMWEDALANIKFLGRYAATKLLEYVRRYTDIKLEMPDIRPIDGWSPRVALAMLYTDKIDYILSSDTTVNLDMIYNLSDELIDRLKDKIGLKIPMFTLEVSLCEYRKIYLGTRFYVGKSHDSEQSYKEKLIPYWGLDYFDMTRVRREFFPNEHIGELNGNWGVRNEDLEDMTKHGLMWSDLMYDYNETKKRSLSFSNPYVRPDADERLKRAYKMREISHGESL